MIGKVVFNLLSNAAGVTAIVGAAPNCRVYPLRNSELKTFPAITYLQIAKTPTDTKDAVSGLDKVDVDVDLFANNYSTLATLADAVRTALDQKSGIIESINVSNSKFVSEHDGIDDSAGLYHKSMQFRFIVIR